MGKGFSGLVSELPWNFYNKVYLKVELRPPGDRRGKKNLNKIRIVNLRHQNSGTKLRWMPKAE